MIAVLTSQNPAQINVVFKYPLKLGINNAGFPCVARLPEVACSGCHAMVASVQTNPALIMLGFHKSRILDADFR